MTSPDGRKSCDGCKAYQWFILTLPITENIPREERTGFSHKRYTLDICTSCLTQGRVSDAVLNAARRSPNAG